MFSVIDAMLDQPMATILEQLPLSATLKQALLDRSGDVGEIIECVTAYDQADWEHTRVNNLDTDTLRQAYLQAIEWTANASSSLR